VEQELSPTLQLYIDCNESVPLSQNTATSVMQLLQDEESVQFEMIELVYVDEEEIVRINKEHLERDYITDIISFRYDDGVEKKDNSAIEGTLFCCAPRIKEQADEYGETQYLEFKRIFIHGLLHLIGYKDKSEEEKNSMTQLENKYLSLSENN
jgi:rRNA maturation RNase YbeY